ncbi:2-oxo acid dehydrogenase subunit E2 [Mycolicibacterium pallens]|uniref:Dihydrolipoamide acetyltransferase component of pyruvate dehydrogenase complex n=1 Tax=Mycolicibacterium pallens TaxID=370524 RepID=A0ABX8VCR6_9MYCO|nr:2-oxo acid dehydrogenase subunit E2 [Mycolicibacterium pallens]QYL15570.1 2-oxo acid dehydrogenase subunit E2 [Mycolicibacterium pallens]
MSETHVTITLPSLGEDVTEATITRWLVSVGDPVDAEDPLVEVATDKVDTEIPSPHAGTLVEILAQEDDTIDVGADIAIIALAQTAPQEPATPVNAPPAAPATPVNAPPAAPATPVNATTAAPPPEAVHAPAPAPASTNPGPAPTPTVAESAGGTQSVQRLPRIRQVIAARMMQSLQTSAQLTSVVEVDVTGIKQLRAQLKTSFHEQTGVKLSFLPFFAKAAVEALDTHPLLGATVNAECTEITYPAGVDLGIAVDSPKGLMVPVIRDAHQRSIADLATDIAALAEQVRAGSISPDALVGGSFTITNTGSRGALFDTPILNSPQSGILGTGAVVERVVPRPDSAGELTIGVRAMVYLALTYDHRVVDGADAARFLATIKTRLEGGFSTDEVLATHARRA